MADRRREPSKQDMPIPRTLRRSRRVVGGKTSVRVCSREPRAPAAPRPKQKRVTLILRRRVLSLIRGARRVTGKRAAPSLLRLF